METYLRDRWASPAPLLWRDAREARCGARLRCALISTGSLAGTATQHAGPGRIWRARFVCSRGIGNRPLIGTGAPIRHSRALSIYPSRSHNFPAILVNPSQSESIRLQHRQSDSVRVDPSLLHIITYYKDYIYF